MAAPTGRLARLRERRPFLDHLVRAVQRYLADAGDRLAASVTYYWFLSLFPILLLAISILGYVYGDRSHEVVNHALKGILPGNLITTIGDTLQDAKGRAGVLGLIGLLLSGLGWIDSLREAIRSMWHQNVLAGNIVTQKLSDVVVLLGLFATVGASVAVTGFLTATTGYVLDLLGVASSTPARLFTRLLGVVLALLADTGLFLYLFARLSRVKSPFHRLIKGALFGAVGFEILKFVGAFYVARTTTRGQATYGAFAVLIGLLLFLNLVSRFIMFTAAWVVTAPYDSDIAPSGTASLDLARKAGIPAEFADPDPDDPPNTREEGAPSPLVHAVQGRTSPQDEPAGRATATGGASTGAGATRRAGARRAAAKGRAAAGVDGTRVDGAGGGAPRVDEVDEAAGRPVGSRLTAGRVTAGLAVAVLASRAMRGRRQDA